MSKILRFGGDAWLAAFKVCMYMAAFKVCVYISQNQKSGMTLKKNGAARAVAISPLAKCKAGLRGCSMRMRLLVRFHLIRSARHVALRTEVEALTSHVLG